MLRIGFATREFTPDQPAMLQGQMHVRVATEAMDPLTVTAMAFQGDGGAKAVLCSCDLAGVPDNLMAAVRQRVAKRLPDVPPEAVMLFGTHTHTSLVMEEGWYPPSPAGVMTAAQCMSRIAAAAAEAIAEAWTSRTPRAVGRAFGHAVVGHNRRASYADGSSVMYGDTSRGDFSHIEGFEDHSVDMLFAWDDAGKLAGLMIAIPCPSQVSEHATQFSADYWHDIRVEVRRRLGQHVQVLGLCAAAGDQSPHWLLYKAQEQEMLRRRGLTQRQGIAVAVADAVERALACTKPFEGVPSLGVLHRHVELTALKIDRKQRDAADEAFKSYGAAKTDWYPRRQREVIEAFGSGKGLPPFPVELLGMRIGDMCLVCSPFELFLDYSLRVKTRSRAGQTVVAQLSGGTGLYLPTRRAVQGGSYGANPAVCQVGPEGGDELVAHSLAMLAELFPA